MLRQSVLVDHSFEGPTLNELKRNHGRHTIGSGEYYFGYIDEKKHCTCGEPITGPSSKCLWCAVEGDEPKGFVRI